MSKKNKKKLRKILRAQAQQLQSANQPEANEQTVVSNLPQTEQVKSSEVASETPRKITPEITEDAKDVKHEIKKILLTMLALFALILIVYFINIKTDIILKFGTWATNLLNINV